MRIEKLLFQEDDQFIYWDGDEIVIFDMLAYQAYNDGKMSDYIPTEADLQRGFEGIPRFEGNNI